MSKLGQNFLTNKTIAKKIVQFSDLGMEDLVLEIGPGKGILTKELAEIAGRIIAIEIDSLLSKALTNKFSSDKKVEIIHGDILKTNLRDILKNRASKYKVIANLPYYITSPIIRMFLESETPPQEMVLMVQKEVAERIVAGPGKMSLLSASVQYYAEPKILFYVSRKNFDPSPEVDSAVIKISNFKPQISNFERKNFFRMVRSGFCAKRKTLANNLANSFHIEKNIVEEKIKSLGLSSTVRAQELDIKDWKKLVVLFQK